MKHIFLIFFLIFFLNCNRNNYTQNEIFTHYLKENYPTLVEKNQKFFIVTNMNCKGCVTPILKKLDTLLIAKKNENFVFLTSNISIKSLNFKNINFLFNEGLEDVNLELTNLTYIDYKNQEIVKMLTIDNNLTIIDSILSDY